AIELRRRNHLRCQRQGGDHGCTYRGFGAHRIALLGRARCGLNTFGDRKEKPADSDSTVRSVQRAATILQLVAAEAGRGLRLSDIARETGLGKATTHRLLTALTVTGLVYQAPE